jgi:dTDP-4-dehydrorhamnose reductase
MRILITGSTGQLGRALTARLKSCGDVIATDRSTLDLARPDAISALLDKLRADLIINTAAYTAVDKAEDEPGLAMRINGEATGVLARWAARNTVPLIHFSSDYVFDGKGTRPWREDDAPNPLSVYGASKLAGEVEARAAGGSFLIVRTSWVFDANGRNFLRTVAALARERDELSVVADQVGAPTSAAVVAEAVASILDGARTGDCAARFAAAQGMVHICASGEASWHHFALAIVEGLRSRGVKLGAARIIPIRSDEYSARARRPLNSRLDLERLRGAFGITTPHWQTALEPELDALAGRRSSATLGI